MPFDRKYIREGYENRAAWPYINKDDPNRWGQMVTWSAFKDAFGREPTDEELARYSSQASQVPDLVRQQILSLPAQQAALPRLGHDIEMGQRQQEDIFRGLLGQEQQLFGQQSNVISDMLQKQRQSALDFYTKGSGAEQLKGAYNNLGLLNSGAFGQGLAQKLADVESGIESQAAGQFAIPSLLRQQRIPMQGADVQSQLGLEGLNLQMYPELQELQLPTQLQQRTFEGMDFEQMAALMNRLYGGGGGGGFDPKMLFQGALGGAGTGAMLGGPWGALIGAGLGTGLGGGLGSMGGRRGY